jgi:hypothetical protein
MTSIVPSFHYFAFELTATPEGTITLGAFTQWAGFADDDPKRELREASVVRAEITAAQWVELGREGMVVNTVEDLLVFFRVGGNALVRKEIAQQLLPDWLLPGESRPETHLGFRAVADIPPSHLNRAPTAKSRMAVLSRDDRRCRICGRRPESNTDVELHVHHIRPWGIGGLSEKVNLLTLCHTCHKGLDPHFDPRLYEYVGRTFTSELQRLRSEWVAGVQRYRALAASMDAPLDPPVNVSTDG